MNKFISEEDIKAQAEKATTFSKAELEWERVRSAGIGMAGGTLPKETVTASGLSLYELLKQKEEQSATEEEEKSRGANLPKLLDEDEARFFDEQRLKEREEGRRLEMQLDQFKRASALASISANPELPLLPVMNKRSPPPSSVKKLSPLALLAAVKTSTQEAVKTDSKKRPAENVEEEGPVAKKPKMVGNKEVIAQSLKPKSLVRYSRDDEE